MKVASLLAESLHGRPVVDGNVGEGVVMHSQDLPASKPTGGRHGIRHAHREIVPDAESGKPQRSVGGNKLQIMGERGVAAVIEGSLGSLDQESSGLPPIRTVRHAAGVDGGGEGDASKVKGKGSP